MTGLGVYKLVLHLRREAQLLALNITVADMERDLPTMSSHFEQRLVDAWDRYMEEDLTTSQYSERPLICMGRRTTEG